MTSVSNPAHAARRLKLPVLQVQYLVSLLPMELDRPSCYQLGAAVLRRRLSGSGHQYIINKSHIPSIGSRVCNRESPTFFVKT